MALVLALVLLSVSAWYFLLPTWITVAVPAGESPEALALSAYAEAFQQRNKNYRLRLIKFGSYRETAEALERGVVDLAVVRTGTLYPNNGLTLILLRVEALMVASTASKKITTCAELSGRRLGVLTREEHDFALVERVLDVYGLDEGVKTTPMPLSELRGLSISTNFDALAFVSTPQREFTGSLLQQAGALLGRELSVLACESPSPLQPALEEVTIPPGALSVSPKLPKEELKTIGVSYRLVGSDRLDRITASNFIQLLVEMRPLVAAKYPLVNLMKPASNEQEMSAALPNHRGAVDYFNREQQTFMDRWGDWLWLGLFAVGGFTSIFAWIGQLFIRKRQEVIDHVLDRLVCIITEARTAGPADLNALAEEIDTLVTYAVRHARWHTTAARTMSALIIALDGARAAVVERRRELEHLNAGVVPEHSASLARGHDLGSLQTP